jgi:CubicO group peptidase (beta-lactamase class C family)
MSKLTGALVADVARYFDSWLAFRQRYDRIPGMQAAVLYDGELLLSTAHGEADLETHTALTPRHLFRVASHSKTFTATAVLQLVERRSLRLDDSAGHWLPFLAETPLGDVSIRELLSHGAGVIRDGLDGDHWQLFQAFPDEERLQAIGTDGADILPANERFKYSNIGYSLLGMIIAAATDQSYNDYVREHIVDRLGLTDTGPEYDSARATEYATGYSALAYTDRRIPIEQVDTAAMASATGFYSTASDLVRYVAAHFHGDDRLLSDASKRKQQRTEWSIGVEGEYALGFDIEKVGDRRVLGHGGGWPGHITNTRFDPVDRLAVSVLTNAIDGKAATYGIGFMRLVELALKATDEPSGATEVDLDRFCGRFANLWGVSDVVRLGDRLYQVTPTGDDPTEEPMLLTVVDDTTLRMTGGEDVGFASPGELLRYNFGPDGVESVRGGNGTTGYPYDRFAAAAQSRERVSLGQPLTPHNG